MKSSQIPDACFTPLKGAIETDDLPTVFTNPFAATPHPIALKAAAHLQGHLENQNDWVHNFGLKAGMEGRAIGKMFGVLVVENAAGVLGYLSAFSGKLAGGNHHPKFVPPVYDSLFEGSFLNVGLTEVTQINQRIKALEQEEKPENQAAIGELKELRRNNSIAMQEQLFDSYSFLNQAGEEKGLREIFANTPAGKPSAGAGECAAPKLLQYAFQHQMKPIAVAEFWWGHSDKVVSWKHLHFYPACNEKCRPILQHMLWGMEVARV